MPADKCFTKKRNKENGGGNYTTCVDSNGNQLRKSDTKTKPVKKKVKLVLKAPVKPAPVKKKVKLLLKAPVKSTPTTTIILQRQTGASGLRAKQRIIVAKINKSTGKMFLIGETMRYSKKYIDILNKHRKMALPDGVDDQNTVSNYDKKDPNNKYEPRNEKIKSDVGIQDKSKRDFYFSNIENLSQEKIIHLLGKNATFKKLKEQYKLVDNVEDFIKI